MNNSKFAIENISLTLEEPIDNNPHFRERESELTSIINAIQGIEASKEWSTLKEKVFDGLVGSLQREIQDEAQKENPDSLKLNRLAGQLKWAEKYSDLKKLEGIFRIELTRIRQQLYGKK